MDIEKKATEQTAAQRALAAEDDAAVRIFQEGCRAYVDVMKRRGIPSLQIGYWKTSYPRFGKPKRSWNRLDVGWPAWCRPLDPRSHDFPAFGPLAVLDGDSAVVASPDEWEGVSVLRLPINETEGFSRWEPYEDHVRRWWRSRSDDLGRRGLWDGVRTYLDVWAILVEENFASALIYLDR